MICLHAVPRAFAVGLGVDDHGIVFPVGDDVGPASQRSCPAAEFKSVLRLNLDFEAADFPVLDSFVDEAVWSSSHWARSKSGGLAGPVLVMGLEPDGPSAGVVAGEEEELDAWKILRLVA